MRSDQSREIGDSVCYAGVERRRHKVYMTQNTEYHFRDGLCVAVKDRSTGTWLVDHVALRRPVSGSLKFCRSGSIRPSLGQPRVGESLFFATSGRDLVTSTLVAIVRPEKNVVESYPKALTSRRV